MPQVYRRHSEYTQRPTSEPRRRPSLAPQATNADDSIVLSDLVRTGEASRLRRRGAMRIDHAASPARPSAPPVIPTIPEARWRAPDSWAVRTPTPPWGNNSDSNGFEDEYVNTTAEWREYAEDSRGGASFGDSSVLAPSDEMARNTTSAADEDGSYVLFCGGEEQEQPGLVALSTGSFEPSPFPVLRSSASHPARGTAPKPRKTNGCGAIVHMRAFPQAPRGVWVGKEEASEVVVGLDASYFERSVVVKMMKSSCGCIREGIGCAVCGNTLGTRYLPCQTMSDGIFSKPSNSTASRAPKPLHPSGPRYWHGRPYNHPRASTSSDASSSSSGLPPARGTPKFYVYTFFADHVSPSRPCAFPVQPPPPSLAATPPYQGSRPTSPGAPVSGLVPPPTVTSFGFRWTASPQALASDETLPVISGETDAQRGVAVSPRTPQFELPDLPELARAPAISMAMGGARVRGGEEEVEGLGVSLGAGMELDADGVVRDEMEEPNSPDKTGEGTMWPGR